VYVLQQKTDSSITVKCPYLRKILSGKISGSARPKVVVLFAGKPVREWGAGLMAVLPRALSYVVSQGRDVDHNKDAWSVSN